MRGNSLNPGDLLSETFDSINPIYTGLLMLAVPSAVVSILGQMLGSAAGVINVLYVIILNPILTGAGIYYAHYYLSQRKNDLGEAFNFAAGKWLNLFLTQLLLILILIPCFFALVIPGIYMSIRLSQAFFGVILENKSPVEAVQYSWEITRNRWWPLFWVFLVLAIACFIIFAGVGFVLGVALATLGISPLVSAVLGGLVGVVLAPVISLYFVLVHRSLRVMGAPVA